MSIFRRVFAVISTCFVLLLWLSPLAASPQTPPAPAASTGTRKLLRLEESADAMGSTYTIIVYGYDGERLETAVEAAFDEVRRLDRVLSNYRDDSELTEINHYAAGRPVEASPELFELLSKCLEYSRESEGSFDITVGPLMRVWGFYKGSGRLPAKEEVARALAKVGYKKVFLNPADRTVRFAQHGVELDPGGIGKGYAVDRIAAVLRDNGIQTALVSAGGSSIYGMGAPPGEPRGWEVKIRDPKNGRKTADTVFLKNESLSTSGNYEKFFEAEGKVYSHIMDPRTGYPAAGMLSVSVVSPRTLDSEAWAKPYFILGRAWAARHKPEQFRVYLCEDKVGQPCEWLQ